ncbi:MAG: twin-arginine translocase TatA/TatE family subunit [Acidimicrobiales bacterium]
MFSLSPIKILIIVAVVLILLGPDKLPEVAERLGRGWRSLRRLQERVESEVRDVLPDLPSSSEIARIARSPVNLLNQLADRASAADDEFAPPQPQTPPSVDVAPPDLTGPAPPTPLARPTERPTSPDPSLN